MVFYREVEVWILARASFTLFCMMDCVVCGIAICGLVSRKLPGLPENIAGTCLMA